MKRPLMIDLFCGSFGWAERLLRAESFDPVNTPSVCPTCCATAIGRGLAIAGEICDVARTYFPKS